MRQLDAKFRQSGVAEILVVYQKEPHCGQMAFVNIGQPESNKARRQLAKRMKDEFELSMPVLVDSMEDQSRELFSDLPSPVFVLDTEGVIQAKFPWPEIELIEKAVNGLQASAN